MMKGLIALALISTAIYGRGQEPLTFEIALANTLENNYDIRLSEIQLEIAENNADKGANGYLPQLTGSGGYNWTYYEGRNNLIIGEQNFDANNSYSYNAGLTVSYSIFDGFGRKFRLRQAEGSQALSALELQRVMENSILLLSQTFHEVARLQQQTESLESQLAISRTRFKRVEYGFEFGQTSQLDILNAQVDLDTDSIGLINSRQQLANTRRSLNLVMGMPVESQFTIQESVQLRRDLTSDEVVSSSLEAGSRMRSAEQSKEIAALAVNVSQATWYPSLGVNGGYQYRGSDDPNGAFLIGSSSYGPTAGLNLSWNIFDGRTKTQVQNAKLQFESSQINATLTEDQVRTDALNVFGAYQNALFVLEARDGSLVTAQRNFLRSEEIFKLGQIGSLEFRQAQLNLLNSELALSGALFDAKNLELQVLALMGALIAQ